MSAGHYIPHGTSAKVFFLDLMLSSDILFQSTVPHKEKTHLLDVLLEGNENSFLAMSAIFVNLHCF